MIFPMISISRYFLLVIIIIIMVINVTYSVKLGTHCAGTVGGINTGVAPKANLYGLKACDAEGSCHHTTDAFEYILSERAANPFVPMVVSFSISGNCYGTCENDPNYLAISDLAAAGVTVVVAAGNDNDDACVKEAPNNPLSIAVGATDEDDTLAEYSNYGECVDVLAPGSDINSASAASQCDGSESCYVLKSGTSMATPHVAGVVALWLAQTASQYTDSLPLPEDIMLALQCDGVLDTIDARSDTLNILLQGPSDHHDTVEAGACESSVGCPEASDGVACSGNGDCLFGDCVCYGDFIGDTCEEDGSPYYVHESFFGEGESMNDELTTPFNSIAFMWTVFDARSAGSIYYGVLDSSTVAFVYEDVPLYYYTDCTVTIEVILHASGSIDMVYVHNDIGVSESCLSDAIWLVSIGLKGPPSNEASGKSMPYEQIYGPTKIGLPNQQRVSFLVQGEDPSTSYPSGPPTSSVSSGQSAGDDNDIVLIIVPVVVVAVAVIFCVAYIYFFGIPSAFVVSGKADSDAAAAAGKQDVVDNPIGRVSTIHPKTESDEL
jgi:hypothetical protein